MQQAAWKGLFKSSIFGMAWLWWCLIEKRKIERSNLGCSFFVMSFWKEGGSDHNGNWQERGEKEKAGKKPPPLTGKYSPVGVNSTLEG